MIETSVELHGDIGILLSFLVTTTHDLLAASLPEHSSNCGDTKREISRVFRNEHLMKNGGGEMKKTNLYEAGGFDEKSMKRILVHDSPYFKILNFNFKAGQELAVHSHDIEGEVSLTVMEGEGEFLGEAGASIPARAGDVLISQISEPHGLRAKTDLRLLVVIAPPI